MGEVDGFPAKAKKTKQMTIQCEKKLSNLPVNTKTDSFLRNFNYDIVTVCSPCRIAGAGHVQPQTAIRPKDGANPQVSPWA